MNITVQITDVRPPFAMEPAQHEVEVPMYREFLTIDGMGVWKANTIALINQLQATAAVIKGM